MGAENHRTARTTSMCQETKKGENNIQARVLIYPSSPKQSTEKRTLHIIRTPPPRQASPKKAGSNKRTAPSPASLNRNERNRASNQPTALSAETRYADPPPALSHETRNAWQAVRRPIRETSDERQGRTAPPDGTENHAPLHAPASDKQSGERGTHDARGAERAGRGASSRDRWRAKPRTFEAKKKTGRGFHSLIPVSRPSYLMGIGLSEAPTICSTCATAAFLVLKP